jgi:hypothetical protein
MGGNAIKNAERMSREEYDNICMELQSQYPNLLITYSLKNKDSYGDIDAVILGEIPKLQNITEIVNNGAFTSVGLRYSTKIHQVDFFTVKTVEEQEHLRAYLSYGIFGMCIGICMNKLGLQYGMDGLKLKVTEGRYMLLSNNSPDIFKFLDLDLDRFNQGFENENELFDYIFTSPYIYTSYDSLLKQSKKAGSRLQPLQQYIYTPTNIPKVQDKEYIIEEVLETFGKREEYASILLSIEKQKRLHDKFNGKVVMDVLGDKLQGKELGSFISEFKSTHDIQTMTENDIKEAIKDLYMKITYISYEKQQDHKHIFPGGLKQLAGIEPYKCSICAITEEDFIKGYLEKYSLLST